MEVIDDNFKNNQPGGYRPWGMEENQFCMLLHLSQFASYIIPMAGIALPIIMWATNKDRSALVDQHGKNVINWIISSFIYIFVGIILTFVLIGIPILIVVGICSLIFAIVGAIRANEGIVYKYPLAIEFIK